MYSQQTLFFVTVQPGKNDCCPRLNCYYFFNTMGVEKHTCTKGGLIRMRTKKLLAGILTVSLAMSGMPATETQAKVRVPSLKKTQEVTVGKTVTLKLNANGNKLTKTSYKVTNKKIATVKKSGKYNAKIKGVKVGTTKLKATVWYKFKKKSTKKTLTCTIKVKKPTVVATKKPTVTVTPTATARPTELPVPTAVTTPQPTPSATPFLEEPTIPASSATPVVTTSPNVSSTPLNTTQTPELTTPPAASLQPTITSEPTETPQRLVLSKNGHRTHPHQPSKPLSLSARTEPV